MTAESAGASRHRWYVIALLMGIAICQTLDRTVLNTLLEPIKREFGLSDSQLGLLAGIAYALPYAITAVPFGMLTDRISRKKLLAFVAAAWSGLTAFSGFASSYWMLLAARAGVGGLESGGPPCSTSLMADYFPSRQRATATAMIMAGVSIGMLIGYGIGGFVATNYGWRHAFFVAGVPGILLALLILFTVQEPPRSNATRTNEEIPPLFTTLRFIQTQKSLVHLIILLILQVTTTSATTIWATSYLVRFHDMPIRDAGIALAIGLGIFSFVGTIAGGAVADRMGKRNVKWQIWVPMISLLAGALLWSAMLLATTRLTTIAFLWGYAFFIFVMLGPVYSMVVSLVGPRMRGTSMAFALLLGNGIGNSVGPQIVGYISDLLLPFFGNASLRYALFIPVLINFWGVWHCIVASRSIEANLSRVEQSAT